MSTTGGYKGRYPVCQLKWIPEVQDWIEVPSP